MICEQCYHYDVCWYRMTVFGPHLDLAGMNYDHMEEHCAKCKPRAEIIELPLKVSPALHDELARYCAERVYDEEQ